MQFEQPICLAAPTELETAGRFGKVQHFNNTSQALYAPSSFNLLLVQ